MTKINQWPETNVTIKLIWKAGRSAAGAISWLAERRAAQHHNRASDITALLLRPPYAIDEPHFQQSCTGCGVCVAACEENLIVMVNQRPALNFSTPYFSTPYCSRCQACSTACQTGALSSAEFHIAARPSVKTSVKIPIFTVIAAPIIVRSRP